MKNLFMLQQVSDKSGFMTLVTVLIIAAVGVSISLTILTSAQLDTQTSIGTIQSDQAKGLAESCTELALLNIAENLTYTGSDTQSIGNGTCTFTVSSNLDDTKRIEAVGYIQDVQSKIVVSEIQYSSSESKLEYNLWQQVADF